MAHTFLRSALTTGKITEYVGRNWIWFLPCDYQEIQGELVITGLTDNYNVAQVRMTIEYWFDIGLPTAASLSEANVALEFILNKDAKKKIKFFSELTKKIDTNHMINSLPGTNIPFYRFYFDRVWNWCSALKKLKERKKGGLDIHLANNDNGYINKFLR